MAIFSFFRTPKPKSFEFKTRYYDPEKEEREEILRKAGKAEYKGRTPKKIDLGRHRRHRVAEKGRMARILAIALILGLLAWILL